MSSPISSSFESLLQDLDDSIILLNQVVNNLKTNQINSSDYRIHYDNYELQIGLAIDHLIKSIRRNCISEKRVLPLAYFCVRTIQELCIEIATVFYYCNKLSLKQKQLRTEVRLMKSIASMKSKNDMEQLLTDERVNVSEECFEEPRRHVQAYQPTDHYKKKGFYEDLNRKASDNLKSLFNGIGKSDVESHLILVNFSMDESKVIFSNLLHGNPIGVLFASEDEDSSWATIPVMLLRMALYDAELIAGFIPRQNQYDTIVRFRDSVLKRVFK